MEHIKFEKIISIIIPVYNGEKTISDCIKSILNQKYDKIEIIIVNDNSTDNTLKILEQFESKFDFIKIINFSENKGSPCAMNTGFKHSNGFLIYYLDSDAELSENFIKKSINIFKDNDIDVLTCRYTPKSPKQNIYEILFSMWQLSDNIIVKSDQIGNIPGCFLGFKREILEHFNFNEKMRAAYDQEFLHRLINNKKNIFFSRDLFVYHPIPDKFSTLIKRLFVQSSWTCSQSKTNFWMIAYYLIITCLFISGIILLIFGQYLLFFAGLILYQIYLSYKILKYKINFRKFFILLCVMNSITLINIAAFFKGIFSKPQKFWKD